MPARTGVSGRGFVKRFVSIAILLALAATFMISAASVFGATPDGEPLPPEQIKEITRDILGGAEFNRQFKEHFNSWEWIAEKIGRLSDFIRLPDIPGFAIFPFLLMILALIALAVLLAAIAWQFAKTVAPWLRSGKGLADERRSELGDLWHGFAEDAAEAMAAADYSAALRAYFLAAVYLLKYRDVLPDAEYSTNGECLRAVALNAPVRRDLGAIVERFDRSWYGMAGASREDAEEAAARFEGIEKSVTGP